MVKKSTSKQDIKRLEQRVEELEDNWKRALADYQNLEQRTKQQQSEAVKFAASSLVDKLLGVLDDLSRAVAHHQDQQWVRLIRNSLSDILSSEGIVEIEARGAKFDPNLMDCTEMVKGPKNKVVSVLLKGYQYHDRVIRPAKVTVGRGKLRPACRTGRVES